MITRSSSLGCSVFAATLSIITVSIITTAAPAFAEEQASSEVDQIIVTGTRLETTQRTDGSSVTVITEQELEDGQYRNAIDALQQVPGLDIVQSGGPGGNASIFLRGADSGQTLIMLDGIELNNPASTNRAFNMANLTLENIERIEIIRGPQSTIYGSDAMGELLTLSLKKLLRVRTLTLARRPVRTAHSIRLVTFHTETMYLMLLAVLLSRTWEEYLGPMRVMATLSRIATTTPRSQIVCM